MLKELLEDIEFERLKQDSQLKLPPPKEKQQNGDRGVMSDDDDLKTAVIGFLKIRPKPKDGEIHRLSTDIGVDAEQLEEIIYSILGSLLKSIGKHADVPDDYFDGEQLEKGIAVEMEHTDDPFIAKLIAKDHLMEMPDYYDRLEEVETDSSFDDNEYYDGDEDYSDEDYSDEDDYANSDSNTNGIDYSNDTEDYDYGM